MDLRQFIPLLMIRISKNSILERILVIVFSTLFLPFVLLYLIFGSHGPVDILLSLLIASINIVISWRLAFNDYDLWLDNEHVIVKQGVKTDVYTVNEFCKFKLEYYGLYLSHSFRYYRLNINGKKYRIRYYTGRINGINDVLDPKSMLNNLEEGMRQEIGAKYESAFSVAGRKA